MASARDHETILRIARMRYEEKRSQQEIARRLGISSSTVSRALQQAMDLGFIEIRVVPRSIRRSEPEQRLEQKYGLDTAIVVDTGSDAAATREVLGRAVADSMMTLLRPDAVIGVSDGQTTAAVARHVRRAGVSGIEVVPLIGGVGGAEMPTHPSEVARSLAGGLGATTRPLPVPAAVDSEEMASALLASSIVRTAFEVIDRCYIALVGVGAISPDAAIVRHGLLTADDMAAASALNAAGTICARFYDPAGRPIRSWIDGCMMALTLDRLKTVPWRIAVAIGDDKVTAIRAAMAGRLVNILGTDTETAAALLTDDGQNDRAD